MVKQKIFLGIEDNEESYINLKDGNLDGWSLMGLRPETEDELRRNQRETDISDYYNIPPELENYIDHAKWEEDMEEGWLEHHDSQGEYTKDGETYYLGFGSGTDIFHFFKKNKIKTYEDFKKFFEETPLDEEKFKALVKIMRVYKKDKDKGYKLFLEWQEELSEYPDFTDEYKEVKE